jgi:hypothetical protein
MWYIAWFQQSYIHLWSVVVMVVGWWVLEYCRFNSYPCRVMRLSGHLCCELLWVDFRNHWCGCQSGAMAGCLAGFISINQTSQTPKLGFLLICSLVILVYGPSRANPNIGLVNACI